MTTRTYRVQVIGQFAALTPERKAQLRNEQASHDVTVSAFTPEGTFTYTSALSRFTLRYLLDVVADSAAQADDDALVEAQLMAEDLLATQGIPHKALTVSAVCLQDVKIKRRR
jgi:hypothetical protein